ncbi:hypothetical protein BDV98DRAFT_573330 [Pterulicium gracile]|uniref:DUF6533 domain-containing protein n=1 Tax=Pterulicium gracile TaxID=1884261 RepID=A0A5C3QB19_9AGAR|nr:hypothetical protein BDV98DRAFT_573330 [Pterula gracilis]
MAFRIPVELFLYYAQIRNYLSVCGYALLVYDHVLTFEDEIQLVWKARPGLTKATRSKATTCFFVVARYVPLIVGVLFCWNFLYESRPALSRNPTVTSVLNGLFIVGIAGCEAILLARTYGIWICSRRMLWFLTVLYTCVLLVCVALLLPTLGGVQVISGANANFIAYIMVIFIETVVIVLTMYRGILDYRATTRSGGVPLILAFSRTMYQDGVQYYLCILACSITNGVLLLTVEAR